MYAGRCSRCLRRVHVVYGTGVCLDCAGKTSPRYLYLRQNVKRLPPDDGHTEKERAWRDDSRYEDGIRFHASMDWLERLIFSL